MKKYKQKLRDVWLQMDEFRPWLRRDPDDSYRAQCRFCKCCVNTKISDLRAHANTKKHLKQLGFRNPLMTRQIDVEGQLVTTSAASAPKRIRVKKESPSPVKKEKPTKAETSDPPVDYEQIIENLALYEPEQVMFANCPLNDAPEQDFVEECEVEGESSEVAVVSVVDEEMVNKAVALALRNQKDSSQVFGDFVADRLRHLNSDAAEFAKDKILKVILEAASIDRAPTYS